MAADMQSAETPTVDRPPRGDDVADWQRLAGEMIAAGEVLAGAAQADRGSAPQIIGLALLARSIGHMRAVRSLIQAGHIVEGRTITRSLFENMFLAVALSEDGETTFSELEADHRASRSKRGKLIAGNTTAFSPEQIAQVEAHLEKLARGRVLTPSEVAKRTSVGKAYLFYAQLSGDSAHPSLDALERHVEKDEAGMLVGLSLEPAAEAGELGETLGWACMALLGTLVATEKLTGAIEASARINAANDAYLRLVNRPPGDCN